MSSTTSLHELDARTVTFHEESAERHDAHKSTPTTTTTEEPIVLPHDIVYEFAKRAMDIFGALVIGAVFLVALPFIALIIRLDSRGPIFYKQTRVGKEGKLFTIWKLRSMPVDAERNGAVWASANDDRVTRVGNFMRKTRIDELPQMWNVLCGEMSLVGPRPERPEFVAMLEREISDYSVRHLVKPGITGWAQVRYRYTDTIEETHHKLEFDLYYLANRSLTLDCSILVKTISVVFRRNGW